MFKWLRFNNENDELYKRKQDSPDKLYQAAEEEFYFSTPEGIDIENLLKEIMLFTKDRVISLYNLKRALLHYMDSQCAENLLKVICYPFFGKSEKLGRKNKYITYRTFNIKIIALDFFKEFSSENIKLMQHPINESIDRELETLYVAFFLITYLRVDLKLKSDLLFDIFDYTKRNGLLSGCKYYTTAFRKFITIQLYFSDIFLNVSLYENRTNCEDKGFDYMFKFKKYLFYLKESKKLIAQLANFISHNLIFFENISNKFISKEEFYNLLKSKNFELLFPRAIRQYTHIFLEKDTMAIKAKLFLNEYTKIIGFYEKKARGTETIPSTNEDLIKDLHLLKDYIKFEEILMNEDNYKFIIENEKYKKKIEQVNLLTTQKEKVKKYISTKNSFLFPSDLSGSLATPSDKSPGGNFFARSSTNNFSAGVLGGLAESPTKESDIKSINMLNIASNPKKCLTVSIKKYQPGVLHLNKVGFNQIVEEDEKKQDQAQEELPEIQSQREKVRSPEPEPEQEPEPEPEIQVKYEEFFQSPRNELGNSSIGSNINMDETIQNFKFDNIGNDKYENLNPDIWVDTITESAADFSLFEIREEQKSEYMYYAEVEQGLLDPKTYELKTSKKRINPFKGLMKKKLVGTENDLKKYSSDTVYINEEAKSKKGVQTLLSNVLHSNDSSKISPYLPDIHLKRTETEGTEKQTVLITEEVENDSVNIVNIISNEDCNFDKKLTFRNTEQTDKGTGTSSDKQTTTQERFYEKKDRPYIKSKDELVKTKVTDSRPIRDWDNLLGNANGLKNTKTANFRESNTNVEFSCNELYEFEQEYSNDTLKDAADKVKFRKESLMSNNIFNRTSTKKTLNNGEIICSEINNNEIINEIKETCENEEIVNKTIDKEIKETNQEGTFMNQTINNEGNNNENNNDNNDTLCNPIELNICQQSRNEFSLKQESVESSRHLFDEPGVDSKLFMDKTYSRLLFNFDNSVDLSIDESKRDIYVTKKPDNDDEMFVFEVDGPDRSQSRDNVISKTRQYKKNDNNLKLSEISRPRLTEKFTKKVK
jgi:hypothetical protein